MVSDSPATVRGLKILVSAVRFCPWPHFPPLEINELEITRPRPKPEIRLYFAITLLERFNLVE
jgi:hypothetical protein